MILTVTLNPAVDISYKLDAFKVDDVNRVEDVSKTAGGKGLNVARVLKQLGEDVAASGFIGGSLGGFIQSQIASLDIADYFVGIAGETRNCIAVIHEGKQTELLESGPVISNEEATLFLNKFTEYVKKVKIVTISGSLPKGLADDFYIKLLGIAASYNIPVLLDVNGKLLKTTLQGEHKPYLIKPNETEFAELLGKDSVDEAQITEALRSDQFADIPLVVVTLGAAGAMVKYNETIYRAKAPKIDAVNPVGSGDSVVAGFARGINQGLKTENLVKSGLAMGVLNALEEKTGHIDAQKVDWAVEQMSVEEV